MDELDKKNKKTIMIAVIVLAIVLVVGTSYALWQLTFTQSGTNVITTGCLQLTLTEDTDAINIADAVPTTDIDGKALEPFTFTLENVCTNETAYVVNLETVSSGTKILADNYVKANLVSGENELFLDNLLEEHVNTEKVISEATTAYKLHQGKLGNKEKISFSLRLWMDEETPALDEVMNASWQGKITVTAEYVPPIAKNLMIPMEIDELDLRGDIIRSINLTYNQNGKYDGILTKVSFQSTINPYTNAEEIVDFSVAQDKSVLGYYVKNEDNTTYTLYIQADGKIKVNQKAAYYGLIYDNDDYWDNIYKHYSTLEGIENLDTSQVTDMSYMFYRNSNESLDLSSFDVSKVTTMKSMFEMSYNHSINMEGLHAPKLESTESMFLNNHSLTAYHSELKNLNINGFNISNVTNMSDMFAWCIRLTTTINITNPNIENYDGIFSNAATEEGAQITLNYTTDTESVVDAMIASTESSNVAKGILIS